MLSCCSRFLASLVSGTYHLIANLRKSGGAASNLRTLFSIAAPQKAQISQLIWTNNKLLYLLQSSDYTINNAPNPVPAPLRGEAHLCGSSDAKSNNPLESLECSTGRIVEALCSTLGFSLAGGWLSQHAYNTTTRRLCPDQALNKTLLNLTQQAACCPFNV